MQVAHIAEHEVLPIIRVCSLGGLAEYVTEKQLFTQHPDAVIMLIDVLSDRGFSVSYCMQEVRAAPDSIGHHQLHVHGRCHGTLRRRAVLLPCGCIWWARTLLAGSSMLLCILLLLASQGHGMCLRATRCGITLCSRRKTSGGSLPYHHMSLMHMLLAILQLFRPVRVDLSTGEIVNASVLRHKFKITFEHSGVRDNLKMLEIAARVTEVRGSCCSLHCSCCCCKYSQHTRSCLLTGHAACTTT